MNHDPQNPKISLLWARRNLRNFAKYEADATLTKTDEQRYRNQLGYQPNKVQVH
jgi:hypothetical protein